MQEKSSVDILLQYPKDMGLDYETHDSYNRFYLFPSDPMLNKKYVIFRKGDLFFCAFDSYAAKAYMGDTFTGVYCVCDVDKDIECKIHKKDWTDFVLRVNKKNSKNKEVARRVTITSGKDFDVDELINEDVAKLFLQINESVSPVDLLIQNDYLPMIKELKGKKVLGLETNQWVCEREQVEALIDAGESMMRLINKTPGGE